MSRMQFGGEHCQRLVADIKTLAIEKVCEFIASILFGNIYDRSGWPVAKVRFVFARTCALTAKLSSGFVTIAIAYTSPPPASTQPRTDAKPTVLFRCTNELHTGCKSARGHRIVQKLGG